MRDAGVVDQDVESAEGCAGGTRQPIWTVQLGEIDCQGVDFDAELVD